MVTFAQYKDAKRSSFSPYNDRREFPVRAHRALDMARRRIKNDAIRAQFDALGGQSVRIQELPDECATWDDLCGDTFDASVNTNIKPAILKREEEEYRAKAEREGIWGYNAQYRDGDDWIDCDAVWGFVGGEFVGSGYDIDLMRAALEGFQETIDAQARAWEDERPDLYMEA